MHDLADPSAGYPQLGELEFLALRGTWLARPNEIRLDRADLVHASSLQPLNRFAPRLSWSFRAGVDQRRDPVCPACTLATAEASVGVAVATPAQTWTTWAMTDVQLQAGPHAAAWWPFVPLGAGAGPLIGTRWQPTRDLVLLASAAWRYHRLSINGDRPRLSLAEVIIYHPQYPAFRLV